MGTGPRVTRLAALALALGSFVACASSSSEPVPTETDIWLNPLVGESCEELAAFRDGESPYGDQLPASFPLPEGAEAVGSTRDGKADVVRATAPGSFRAISEFFKTELVDEGWSNGDSSAGSDPTGEYSRVAINERGYEGAVRVIGCPDEEPAILIELATRSRS